MPCRLGTLCGSAPFPLLSLAMPSPVSATVGVLRCMDAYNPPHFVCCTAPPSPALPFCPAPPRLALPRLALRPALNPTISHDGSRKVDVRLPGKREFKLPWREAGPPNHRDDKVDSEQQVVNKELSLMGRVFQRWREWHSAGLTPHACSRPPLAS